MPTTKDQLIHAIESQRARLDGILARLSPDDMVIPGAIGEWSVKDTLAHIADWEQRFLGWYRAQMRGETPAVPGPGLTWRDLDALNQAIHERHRDRALDDVWDEYRRSYAEMRAAIGAIPAEDLIVTGIYPWIGADHTLSDFIAGNSSEHYAQHRADLERWLAAKQASCRPDPAG
jgi:hypothetical protein